MSIKIEFEKLITKLRENKYEFDSDLKFWIDTC